jgi:dipeptidyl aminopeptidase/acylaminoacyl peptidase
MIKLRSYLSATLLLIVLCMSQRPVEAQSTNMLSAPIWMDWSNDGSKLVTVSPQGLTVYDSAFTQTNFRAFPSDITFEIPKPYLSPDGTRILVGREIWDAVSLQTLLTFNTDFPTTFPQWSHDSASIAFRNWNTKGTSIYSAEDGTLLREFSSSSWVSGYEDVPPWSPNERYFAITGGRSVVVILDAATGADVARYTLVDQDIGLLTWSPDSTRLAITTSNRVPLGTSGSHPDASDPSRGVIYSVIVLNVSDGQMITTITGLRDGISDVAWSPDGSQLAGYDMSRTLYVWDASTGLQIERYLTPPYLTNFLKYSPYGGRLMVGFEMGRSISRRDDNPPVPTATFMQPALGGSVQLVAPAASANRLQDILAQCVTDQDALTTGNNFITAGEYAALMEWVDQLPDSILPAVCAADLDLVAQAVSSRQR